MLNTAAEAFAHGETDVERCFSAICYELNGEPYAALNSMTDYTINEDNPEMYFAHACMALWRALYILKSKELLEEVKKVTVQKAIMVLREEKNYRELGNLLKIQKLLLKKSDLCSEDFFQDIDLPSIVILKIFTPNIPFVFSNDSIKISMENADKLKDKVAFVITSCTNVLEQKMLKTFIRHGIKPICVPLMPIQKLRNVYCSQEGDEIIATMSECEVLEPIADYSPKEAEVWPLVENYGIRYLLGIGLLYKEEMELPVRYVWGDFTTSYPTKEIEVLCMNNGIDIVKIGGHNA